MGKIVKRKGRQEKYDQRKVYASVYSAAMSCHYSEEKSEKIASGIVKKLEKALIKKPSKKINSSQIRDFIIKCLNDEDVVLMYKHHLDLS